MQAARNLPLETERTDVMEKTDKIWLDGEMVPWDEANVHVMTHTLHYGLGVFEGIRAYQRIDGRSHVFRLDDHVRRLFDGARITMMDIPYTPEQISAACIETLRVNKLRACYIRPLVFMGYGAMGLYATSNPIRVAIACWPWGAYLGDEGLQRGIRAKISSFTRHHVNASMVKGKIVGQYVNSILAKREVTRAGYQEALMLDTAGYVTEASGQNIFMVRDGIIHTPGRGSSLLNGITRDSVLRIARDAGYEIAQQRFTRDELYTSDEVFLTGTAAELTPVREIDDRPVGTGEPGPVTKHLQEAYFDVVRGSHSGYEDWLHFYEV